MRKSIPILAVAVLLGVMVIGAAVVPDSDATDTSNPSITEYKGKCGGTGTADWIVKNGELSIIGTGNVSATSSWTITPTGSKIADVLKEVKSVKINNSGTVTKQVFNQMAELTSVSFGTSHKIVDESLFEANKKIDKVDLKDVTVVGKNAFKGCTALTTLQNVSALTTISESAFEGCTAFKTFNPSEIANQFGEVSIGKLAFKGCTALEQFHIGKAKNIDLTAFEGCTKLTKFISDPKGTTYAVSSDLIYGDGKKTLYMIPTGKTGVINKVEPTVTKINLGYADVDLIINASEIGNRDMTFNSQTGSKSTAVVYYTQSISNTPVAKIEKNVFTMTYQLYKGWTVDSTTVRVAGGTLGSASSTSLTMSVSEGKGYSVYPVGYSKVTEDDLKGNSINNWTVDGVILKCDVDSTSKAVKDITEYTCIITGYSGSGSAVLEQQLKNRGALCTVTEIKDGKYSGLVNLTIKGDMIIRDGTFANCPNLKTVSMSGITEIKPMLFRYCTSLESVDAKACTKIGEYAFEGCVKMSSIALGAKTVEVAGNAFANCSSLKMLKVGMETEVKGNPGLFILHTDDGLSYEIYGDSLVVKGSGKELSYYQDQKDTPKTAKFYSGGMASVFIGGIEQLFVKTVSGAPESDCLVVLESQMGIDVQNMVVKKNTALKDLQPISSKGYTFKGWYTEKGGIMMPVTQTTTVTDSMVLTAMWERDVSSDKTPLTLVALFGISVVASVVILAINTRR